MILRIFKTISCDIDTKLWFRKTRKLPIEFTASVRGCCKQCRFYSWKRIRNESNVTRLKLKQNWLKLTLAAANRNFRVWGTPSSASSSSRCRLLRCRRPSVGNDSVADVETTSYALAAWRRNYSSRKVASNKSPVKWQHRNLRKASMCERKKGREGIHEEKDKENIHERRQVWRRLEREKIQW